MSTESNDPGSEPGSSSDPPSFGNPDPPPASQPPMGDEPEPQRGGAANTSSVDLASVPTPVWISAGSALVLLISVFLSWYTAKASISLGGFSASKSASGSGWDSGSTAKFIALLALIVLVVWAIELFAETVDLPWPASMVAIVAGGISVLLVLFKVVSKPSSDAIAQVNASGVGHISVSTSWGIWLALLAAIGVAVGGYLRMNESGA